MPRVRGWKQVIELLDCDTTSPDELARTILKTADQELRFLKGDELLTTAFWKIVRLTWASRKSDFTAALQEVQLPADSGRSIFTLTSAIEEACVRELRDIAPNPAVRELLAHAVHATLLKVIAPNVPSMFGAGPAELQQALAHFTTKENFGALNRALVSEFFGSVLEYVASRHEPRAGGDTAFSSALRNWAWETSRLVEGFSGDWYSKHNWDSKGNISKQETRSFVAYALEKLSREISITVSELERAR